MLNTGAFEDTDGYSKARVLGDFWLYVWDEDTSLTPSLKQLGYWESWITSWFTRWVRPGMTVLDIGANCGYYTMLSEKLVGPYGRVISYEPNPTYIRALFLTGIINNARFVRRPYAVGNSIETVKLHVPKYLTGSAAIGIDLSAHEEHVIEVEQTTLDYEYRNGVFEVPHIIKIDAEGAEENIWNGGYDLWDAPAHTTIIMEWTPNAYSDGFYDRLKSWGDITLVGYDGSEVPTSKDYLQSATDWQTIVVRKV